MKTIPILTDRQLLEQIYKRLVALEKKVGDTVEPVTASDWITPKDIQRLYSYKPRTINEMRRDGRLRKFKAMANGKNFKYSKKECEQKLVLRIA